MNVADFIVIAVIAITGLSAWYLGFVRVVTGVGGWVCAALATFYGFHHLKPVARGVISDSIIADGLTVIVVFIVTLVVLSFLSHAVSRRIRDSGFRQIDRALGLIAGLTFGIILLSGLHLIIDQATEGGDQPAWFRTARTEPMVRRASQYLWSLAPSKWQLGPRKTAPANGQAGATDEAKRRIENLINPVPKGDAPKKRQGYTAKEREEMDRLIRGQK